MALDILIIDDSPVLRKVVIRNLRQAGLEIGNVFEANDGYEGIEALNGEPSIKLVLCDWNMPNMDGLTFVKTVRLKGIQVPIVMVTTEATETRIAEAKEAGANGYICKPFTPYSIEKELKPFF